MTGLSTFTPTGAPFYDAHTISALVTNQLGRIWADVNAGRITDEQGTSFAATVHAVAMECRADAGLVERCAHCGDPIEVAGHRSEAAS